jgi:catechol 2,3-dioxygenase-like lactoylglutathione lyase family enzyme
MASTDVRIEVQPRLVIEHVDDAIAFYRAAFGAELIERYVDSSGVVVHAAVRIGTSIVTMAEEVKAWRLLGPTAIGGSPVCFTSHFMIRTPPAPSRLREVARWWSPSRIGRGASAKVGFAIRSATCGS